uniref:Glucosidase 2 subunit beta n=1 Tax=Sphaeramia orbicularis TaxID=375764 RepID=A0A673C3V9_9TELE
MYCPYLLLLLSLGVSAVEVQRPRGVPLSKRQFYEEGKPFTCLDGSRTIPFDRVNDDYCDCQDGSDEPGTAACPNGSFHCTNAGFRPAFIPSSRINDGICDCCDTTDEYNSGAACQNTCRELGRKERESLQKMAEIAKEGFMLKQQLIQEAKRGMTTFFCFLFVHRNIEKEISFDFGPSAEFGYLYNQCYELTTSEYIYRLCPFSRVSQKPKYGGSETSLGTWGKWAGPDDNVYSVMKYEHGTGCWQGPNRSTTVKLTCGKETVVTSTSEPSRCEYLMEFTTPAVCQEPPSLDSMHPDHEEL